MTATLPVPAHVPPERVVDFDLYDPPGADSDFHASWKALQDRSPDLVWTTADARLSPPASSVTWRRESASWWTGVPPLRTSFARDSA